jgi:hypothetical protein
VGTTRGRTKATAELRKRNPLIGQAFKMVGVAGFEPATTRTPSECATSLRHTPTGRTLYIRFCQDQRASPGGHGGPPHCQAFFLGATRGRHCTNARMSSWNVHALFD